MSKTMTRFLSLLLIAVLAISLCGCGGEGKKTESNQIKLEDYELLYKDACIMTDSDGNDAVVLTLDFTNNSKESASYLWSINETLTQDGDNRVRVGGIKGKAKPDQLKLCLGYHAGYKVVTYLSFAWPDAYEKAQYAADILMKKMKRKGMQYEDLRIDYVGLNALHLDVAEIDEDLIKRMNEVVLRIAIRTKDKKDAQLIIPEISPLQLNGPPGASFFGGRAHVTDVIGLWPTLIPRDAVKLESHILEVK